MKMQMESMEAFVLLCQIKNMTQAARQLHISQQGLSRQIKQMEKELNVQLFVRSVSGMEPTVEAEILCRKFKKACSAWRQGIRDLEEYQKDKNNSLHIAVCPGIKQSIGLEAFFDFQKANPQIDLSVEFRSDEECEELLQSGSVDAAFLDWPTHSSEYKRIPLIRSPLVAVMSKDFFLADRKTISMNDLYGLTVYIPDQSHRMSQRFKEHWPDIYKSVHIQSAFNDYESFYSQLPKKGEGVALTFEFLC